QAARREETHQDRRGVAALAGRGGASVVGLLSRGEEARRGASGRKRRQDAGQKEGEEGKEEWLTSTARACRRAQAGPDTSSSCCTATAPTATTSSTSGAPGRACCRTPPLCRRTRRGRAARRR